MTKNAQFKHQNRSEQLNPQNAKYYLARGVPREEAQKLAVEQIDKNKK